MNNTSYYAPGSLLILASVSILAVPEIIFALIVVFIILAGIAALYLGHAIRKPRRGS